MNIIKTDIEGVLIIEPRIFEDSRGYFFESFNRRDFEENVGQVDFVQDNESKSSYGVVRGLHFQKGEHAQAKLVRVVKGTVLDVAVDIRPGSPTFGRRQSPPVLHAERYGPRIQCPVGRSRVPVQMR